MHASRKIIVDFYDALCYTFYNALRHKTTIIKIIVHKQI